LGGERDTAHTHTHTHTHTEEEPCIQTGFR